jgi:predicted nuclease of predicted toxin-antitoxin system
MSHNIKLQTDEHIPTAVILGLRQRGIDVLSTPQAGLLGASDESQLNYAVQQQRVIVTQDDDFLVLHAQGVKHAGIIFVQPEREIGRMVRGLFFISQALTAEEMQNHVEFL